MYASNSHSYTHLILVLGIVREPTVWGFITSHYPGMHDFGLATKNVDFSFMSLIVIGRLQGTPAPRPDCQY